ncbi:MAG: stage II sporulation protein M [Anaerolineae bacterium]|nr:stage II sporulation protein M [Anaerolineae bacterium]MDW8069385.1 stage II sporulation protein M [Anaerolineae bacterium]
MSEVGRPYEFRRSLWIRQIWHLLWRELRDYLRDWRILFPIFALTLLFPFVMRFITGYLESSFYERWGAEGVTTRLLPLMLLLVGFVPVSISLVIALETFVGEKERMSLEPLLATPLSNLQLYMGKMMAALLLPLMAATVGIAFYMTILPIQARPNASTLLQIMLLTFGKALVMVSGAVIVSSQTTSVRAANLLASFILVPMALLVQQESFILLEGGNRLLWYILLFLLVANVMLVRMGIRLFNREELLGREIDELNLRNIWRMFRKYFVWERWFFGQPPERLPRSLRWVSTWTGLYLREIPRILGRSRLALALVLVSLLGAIWVGGALAIRFRLPSEYIPLNQVTEETFRQASAALPWLPALTVWGILGNNLRSLTLAAILGTCSFGALAAILLMIPIAIIAYLTFQVAWAGYDPLVFLLTFIFPHGVLELPAAIFATALAVRLGATFIAPPRGMNVGEGWMQALTDFVKGFLGVAVPLLALAAAVEVFLTPALVLAVYGK